jgi:hypothetical protein
MTIMANNENGSAIHRKGKPTGNGRESEGLNEAFAGTDPETENEIRAEYIDEKTDKPADNVEVKHANRHLHKGEELAKFKDLDDE